MRFPLNVVTLAVLSVSSAGVLAADFGVHHANTSKIKLDAYQCKQCKMTEQHQGYLGMNFALAHLDSNLAANQFGDTDEPMGHLEAAIHYQNKDGYRSQLQAHRFASDNGFLHLESGHAGLYKVGVDVQNIRTWDAVNGVSPYWQQDHLLVAQESHFDLSQSRKNIGLDFEYQPFEMLNTYVTYERQSKEGLRDASLFHKGYTLFAQQINETTDKLTVGGSLTGQNWLLDLNYRGSDYQNDVQSAELYGQSYAATPDNSAHQFALSGQYRYGNTVVLGRVIQGEMRQDAHFAPALGLQYQNWDGQISTLESKLAITSLLTPRWRFGASVGFAERKDESSVIEILPLTRNTLRDLETTKAALNTSYRIASGYRLQAGVDFKQTDRSYGERETVDENEFWAELDVKAFERLAIELKLSHNQRDGSEYQANALTGVEMDNLLRKYHLADRDRNQISLRFDHQPLSWLAVDLTSYYAIDDYSNSQVGLTEATDLGYDLTVSAYQGQLHGYASIGQQWVTHEQTNGHLNPWTSADDDRFITLASGVSYQGLWDNRLTVGADYVFAQSEGETLVNADLTSTTNYGVYDQWSHNLSLYNELAATEKLRLKVSYDYERYFDTDASRVRLDSVTGLETLGFGDNNYNAHQVTFAVRYLLP